MSIPCTHIIRMMEEDYIEDFVERIDNNDNELTGKQQGRVTNIIIILLP